ncbi:MAG: BON domain-containing protein [Anaerolineae bacterium]
MSEPTVITQPDDTVIYDDIRHLIATYPPLVADRSAIQVTVENGAVVVSGHVMSANTRRFFLNELERVPGISSVNAEGLYDDTSVRLDVSRLLPPGLQANVRHGVVILSGEHPIDQPIEAVADQILALPGVAKVVSSFGG